MELLMDSMSGDLPSIFPALRSSQNIHLPFSSDLKSVVTLGAWNVKNSLRIRSASDKLTSNSTQDADTVLIKRVFAEARKLEETLSKGAVLSENDKMCMYLGLLESDLQAALTAFRKKEENLKDAERRVLLEQDKLNQTKQDLGRLEEDIVSAFAQKKQIEEDLEKVNRSLASQSRQIKDLRLLVEDQSKKIAVSQHSLSLKEDELSGLTDDLRKRDMEAETKNRELQSKNRFLHEVTQVIKEQEEKLKELQKEVTQKEHDLAESLQLMKAEQEVVKIREADLKKRTVEWLSVQQELKALAEQASEQTNGVETSEDFKRVRSLLSDLRLELVSSQKEFVSYQKSMEEQADLLEEKGAELNEQKLLVMSYKDSLKDAVLELESESTQLSDAVVQFDELKTQLSDARKLIIPLEEEVRAERATLEQQTQEVTSLQKELEQRELDYNDTYNLLQAKKSEVVAALLEIQQMESEQARMQLALQEKDGDLLKAQNALAEVQHDIACLEGSLSTKGQQLTQATMRLREKEDHTFTMRRELDGTKSKSSEVVVSLTGQLAQLSNNLEAIEKGSLSDAELKVVEVEITRLYGLTEKLVKEAGITANADVVA